MQPMHKLVLSWLIGWPRRWGSIRHHIMYIWAVLNRLSDPCVYPGDFTTPSLFVLVSFQHWNCEARYPNYPEHSKPVVQNPVEISLGEMCSWEMCVVILVLKVNFHAIEVHSILLGGLRKVKTHISASCCWASSICLSTIEAWLIQSIPDGLLCDMQTQRLPPKHQRKRGEAPRSLGHLWHWSEYTALWCPNHIHHLTPPDAASSWGIGNTVVYQKYLFGDFKQTAQHEQLFDDIFRIGPAVRYGFWI